MSKIADLRKFLIKCPFLKIPETNRVPRIYIDGILDRPVEYEIIITPATQWVTQYVDGGGIKQLNFLFRSVEYYNPQDIENNISNNDFYEQFETWLNNTKPDIPGWIKAETLTCGYFNDSAESLDKATYQIQCRILYSV